MGRDFGWYRVVRAACEVDRFIERGVEIDSPGYYDAVKRLRNQDDVPDRCNILAQE